MSAVWRSAWLAALCCAAACGKFLNPSIDREIKNSIGWKKAAGEGNFSN